MTMIVTAKPNTRRWTLAVNALIARLHEAGVAASKEGAEEIQKATRARLSLQRHGVYSDSPARAPAPPAMITGALMESISVEMFGDQAWVGPTAGYGRTGEYARILELGGDMHGHPLMIWHRWFRGNLWPVTSTFVRLYPRPYLEPSTDEVVDSGLLWSIYIDHWSAAIEELG